MELIIEIALGIILGALILENLELIFASFGIILLFSIFIIIIGIILFFYFTYIYLVLSCLIIFISIFLLTNFKTLFKNNDEINSISLKIKETKKLIEERHKVNISYDVDQLITVNRINNKKRTLIDNNIFTDLNFLLNNTDFLKWSSWKEHNEEYRFIELELKDRNKLIFRIMNWESISSEDMEYHQTSKLIIRFNDVIVLEVTLTKIYENLKEIISIRFERFDSVNNTIEWIPSFKKFINGFK